MFEAEKKERMKILSIFKHGRVKKKFIGKSILLSDSPPPNHICFLDDLQNKGNYC